MKYLVTNFAYGTGPYIRTTELAIAFNTILEKKGHARLGIIVPWVYGEKQHRIMFEEEFAAHEAAFPGEIVLDATLGAYLKSIFYGELSYEEALVAWTETAGEVGAAISAHLAGSFSAVTYGGEERVIDGADIVVELNRSPRVAYNIAPTYSTTFGHIADILARTVGVDAIAVDDALLQKGVATAKHVESQQTIGAVAYPATFSFDAHWEKEYAHEVLVPPITSQKIVPHTDDLARGVYVTITGVPGLERLYEEAKELGLQLYSNDPESVRGSTKLLPEAISNENIVVQFARAGWGSIWYSMLCEKPIVIPAFDAQDDPEIYWNNKAVEALGIGIIYRGQSLAEVIAECPRVRERCAALKAEIMEKWGTLDGHHVAAELFVSHFLDE